MKTLHLVITIIVPDNVTLEMLDISTLNDGYFIGAFDENSKGIHIPDDIAECSIDSINDINNPTSISLNWSIDDFETRALELEEEADKNYEPDYDSKDELINKPFPIYNRTKFPNALYQMQHHHDCNNGITWDTIDFYLHLLCLLNEEPITE